MDYVNKRRMAPPGPFFQLIGPWSVTAIATKMTIAQPIAFIQHSAACETDHLGSNRMRRKADLKSLAHCPENGGQVIHAGVARWRKHPVQTFAWLGR